MVARGTLTLQGSMEARETLALAPEPNGGQWDPNPTGFNGARGTLALAPEPNGGQWNLGPPEPNGGQRDPNPIGAQWRPEGP